MLDSLLRWSVSGGKNEGEVHGIQRVYVSAGGGDTEKEENNVRAEKKKRRREVSVGRRAGCVRLCNLINVVQLEVFEEQQQQG